MARKPTPGTSLAYLKMVNGTSYAVYPALNKKKLADAGHPEEMVRLTSYNELIQKYKYPPSRIQIEYPVKIRDDEQPRFADIVVFDDDEHRRPLIVVETKRPGKNEGERQGQRYASILRAVYVLWTNGSGRSTSVLVNRYPEEAEPIADIPPFGGEPVYDIVDLHPFADDRDMANIIRKCHDTIRSIDNKKPDSAFQEFLKVLFVKFRDERRDSKFEFQVLLRGVPPKPESTHETAQRVRAMFHSAAIEDTEIAGVFSEHDDIELSNDCLTEIVRTIQRYSFSSTEVDQKARAFETFLSNDMRQEFKEFMTPRVVVEAIVAMADPSPADYVLDPCCGSAAFLVYSLKYVREQIQSKRMSVRQKERQVFDFAHDRLWGTDSSAQMSNVGRLNMLVNEDGRAHIFNHDALKPTSEAPPLMRGRMFDIIMTNPPFGTRIAGHLPIVRAFGIAQCVSSGGQGQERAHLTEVLFLERNLEWLKSGGRMFIVLPDSVLGNKQLSKAREYIEQRARLVGVLSLSSDTFGPSGAKSKTSVVILEKRQDIELDYVGEEEVFLADVRHIGYDFTGRRAAEPNQLPDVVNAFAKWEETGEIPASASSVALSLPRSQLGSDWVAGPHFSRKSPTTNVATSAKNYWELSEIAERIDIGKTAARSEYTDSGIHIVKVGNLTGRGIQWGCVERQYVAEEWAEWYPHTLLKKGDILFTSAAHGPKWIGLKVDMFTSIPEEFGVRAVFCAELMRVTVRSAVELDPYYLLLFLRSAAGYAEIQRCIRGQSGHIYKEDVAGLRVPKPLRSKRAIIDSVIGSLKSSMNRYEESQKLLRDVELNAANLFPTEVKKPIIAR